MVRPAELSAVLSKEVEDLVQFAEIPNYEFVQIGESFRDQMLQRISRGVSPINGKGRFPAYKNPENYPDRVRDRFPSKRRRPVNLRLSGEFLKNLDVRVRVTGSRTTELKIGFFDKESIDKERGHRNGANGQPKRPIIPQGNETFVKEMTDNLLEEVADAFDRAIK